MQVQLQRIASESVRLKRPILVLALLLLLSIPLAMQFDTGSIEGFISDDRGRLPGASVEARNATTGDVQRTVSEPTGYYKLEGIHAGRYSLWVEASGHDSVRIMRVPVEHGQSVHQDVFLARSNEEATDPH